MSGSRQPIKLLREALLGRLGGIGEILRFDNRFQLLYQRLLQKHQRLAVYRLGDIEAVVDIAGGDLLSVRACLASPMYRALLARVDLPSSLSVADLGANSGGFPLLLLSLGYKLEDLLCVELNPRTALRLRYNLQGNLPLSARWDVREAAIVGKSRRLKVHLGRGSAGDSIYGTGTSPEGTDLEVEGVTLDDCFRQAFDSTPIDLCKMDIEGAEYEVFESSAHDRIKQCRCLLIEIHATTPERRDGLFARLAELGFNLIGGPSDRRFGVEYCFVNKATVRPNPSPQ
jgi:FkbM family methyltransferase